MHLDHVTLAGPSLSELEEIFRRAGLETEYGGPHSNGATHMALLGFDDGSYIELISLLEDGVESPLWHRQIVEDGGPAAWAVVVDDLPAEVERLRSLDIPVRGPVDYHRTRPDGVSVEWELAFPGAEPPGAVLPFLIQDRTPRERRVRPSPSVAGSELSGVAAVVLAVRDVAATMALFRRCYGWAPAIEADAADFGARLAHVPGTPLILAEPLPGREPVSESASEPGHEPGREPGHDRLADRIERFGESPCAFLVRSRDLAATRKRIADSPGEAVDDHWFGRPLVWLNSLSVGFIE